MTKVPEISVIVAVYKAEAYIRRCLDSIAGQTFTDFEVIMVDDGSPDRSGEICEEYAARDPRFRVIHKGNGGVATARQCGLDNSTGTYTIHVDPDDWIEPQMFELMLKSLKENNADICICNMVFEYPDHKEIRYSKEYANDILIDYKDEFNMCAGSGLTNKLIKRSVYTKHNIYFPSELRTAEDSYVLIKISDTSPKVCYIPNLFYHYDKYSNDNTLSRLNKYSLEMFSNKLKYLPYLCEICDEDYYNKSAFDIAHQAFFYGGVPTKEIIKNIFPLLVPIMKAKAPVWRKVNIIICLLGLKSIYRPIYMFIKKNLAKKPL